MRTEILRLHRRLATTIIYVTHDQVEAMTMSTRLAVMEHGNAAQIDDPRTVFGRPARESVATFIGMPAMNVLDAAVEDRAGVPVLTADGLALPLSREDAAALDGLARVRLGIRPQALALVPPGEGLMEATILLREPLGLEDEVLLQLTGGRQIKVVGRFPGGFGENAPVAVTAERDAWHVFHPDSGQTLLFGLAAAGGQRLAKA
jgi:multiple sugar transport system ATP-binding protein